MSTSTATATPGERERERQQQRHSTWRLASEIGIAIETGIGIHSVVTPATSTKLYQTEANKETETEAETQRLETAPTVAAPVIERLYGDGEITAGLATSCYTLGSLGNLWVSRETERERERCSRELPTKFL